jgi:serine protease Do/serine protease DegQ
MSSARRIRSACMILGLVAAAGLSAAIIADRQAEAQKATVTDRRQPASPADNLLERASLAPMLEKVLPAVVSIRVKGLQAVEQNPLFNHPLFGQMVKDQMAEPQTREFVSSGSGVVVDTARGLIVTNYHVIEKAKEIKVHLQDGREFDGKLLGRDAATDVATVQIEATNMAGVPIGDSTKVRVGDLVVAIGNPFGLDATATLGMVSSLARTTVGYRDFEAYIQHDAAVNSGNSGGALINMKGELIGINTAILSPSGGNVGLGFAIPSKMAWHVMEQLVKYGRVRRGWTGAKVSDLTQAKIAELDLGTFKGAIVTSVVKGSPAEQAGAQVNDVITAVTLPDGQSFAVNNAAQMLAGEAVMEIGQKVTVHVIRNGQPQKVPVVIGDLKREPERVEIPSTVVRMAGVVVGSLEADSPLFGELKGVEVLEVKQGTLAQLVGLLPGDIITQVEQDRIRRPDELLKLVKEKNAKFEMRVVRNGVPVLIKFPL